jgi:hypothetical protein
MAQERMIADVWNAIPRFTRGTKIAATAASRQPMLPVRSGDDRPGYGAVMRLDEIGEIDGWRCWLCDEPVDPTMSVNDPRGPSIDSRTTERKAKAKGTGKGKGKGTGQERLAHRACNTGKGAVEPVIPWPDHLFVADAAVIIPMVDRLQRKGGREVVARCPDRADADAAAAWLVDRISRLEPELDLTSEIETGGGQYLVILRA